MQKMSQKRPRRATKADENAHSPRITLGPKDQEFLLELMNRPPRRLEWLVEARSRMHLDVNGI